MSPITPLYRLLDADSDVVQLENDIAHMICPVNHQPSLIKGLCPTGSQLSTGCAISRAACRPRTLGWNKLIPYGEDTQANRQRFIDMADRITRGKSSEPKWSDKIHSIHLFFPSPPSTNETSKLGGTNAEPI